MNLSKKQIKRRRLAPLCGPVMLLSQKVALVSLYGRVVRTGKNYIVVDWSRDPFVSQRVAYWYRVTGV